MLKCHLKSIYTEHARQFLTFFAPQIFKAMILQCDRAMWSGNVYPPDKEKTLLTTKEKTPQVNTL